MNYNPDVLTCLANLSNDEVFTPPDIANQMLDTTLEKEVIKSERYLKTEISDTVIRDFRQISIIEKAQQFKEKRFSEIVSPRKPFGFDADFFNKPERYPDIRIEKDSQPHLCKIYGVKGKKGGAKRVVGYIF